jgi:hypothetical protein
LLSTQACDSIATLKLIVNPFLTSTTKAAICPAQLPYLWNGRSYTAAGTYTTTIQNATGCDSVASLVLTVDATLKSVTEIFICSADLPYTWNGERYDLVGTYSKMLKSYSGCDSVATLILGANKISTA